VQAEHDRFYHPDVVGLSNLSIARDGTGGLVYLKQVSGVPHVFVSRLVGALLPGARAAGRLPPRPIGTP